MACRVRGCVEIQEGRGSFIENVEDDKAEFFGVSSVLSDGTEMWLADFLCQEDAEAYAAYAARGDK
jgi:hypothetical protein